MTGFSESADQIALSFSSKLNKQGEVSGKATFSMVNLMNLSMDMVVKKLDLLSFSPIPNIMWLRQLNKAGGITALR